MTMDARNMQPKPLATKVNNDSYAAVPPRFYWELDDADLAAQQTHLRDEETYLAGDLAYGLALLSIDQWWDSETGTAVPDGFDDQRDLDDYSTAIAAILQVAIWEGCDHTEVLRDAETRRSGFAALSAKAARERTHKFETPSSPGRSQNSSFAEWNRLVEAHHGQWDYTIEQNRKPEPDGWTDVGMPAETALKFQALLLEPIDAVRLHHAGFTPEDALPYVVVAESTRWWNWPDFNIVEWVIQRVPANRVRVYEGTCSAADAVVWETLAARHGIADPELRDAILSLNRSTAALADSWAPPRAENPGPTW